MLLVPGLLCCRQKGEASRLEGPQHIRLLAEPGWRGARARQGEASTEVRPNSIAGLTTPSAPSLRSAHPPLLCEEGNMSSSYSPLPSSTGLPCGVRRYASAHASLRAASASPSVKPFD